MEVGLNHIHRVYGFSPLLCDEPRILILGTLPGGKLGKNDLDFKMLKICSRLLISYCIIFFSRLGAKKNTENPSDDGIMGYINNIKDKDKDGIDLNSIEGLNLYPDMLSDDNWHNIHCAQGDTAVLWGLRNNKLWVSLFNNQTKQQLMEWNGSVEVTKDIDITINKGYGESETLHYDKYSVCSLNHTPFGYIGCCQCKDEYYNGKLIKDWFIINNENLFYFNTTMDDKVYSPGVSFKSWYNNSIIISFSELPTDLSSIPNISNTSDLYSHLWYLSFGNGNFPNRDKYTCVILTCGQSVYVS